MLENILNSFDPPAFFTAAPLWVSFILPGAIMGIVTAIIGLTILLIHEHTKDKDIEHSLSAVLGVCTISVCIVTALAANIAAVCLYPGAALSPALKAYGVTEPFPTMAGNFIAFIANTLCFFMAVIACFGAGRSVARIANRRETRRKYLEARALERATRD
jgi:threonine/homoserine/homoserine lactone efflux protein|nr:MAG TPA: hypothetical protein [Caudoviricetes sp.]